MKDKYPEILPYEIEALQMIPLKEGAVLFDIGSNTGTYTLMFSDIMNGKSFSVHSFEPIPELCIEQGFKTNHIKDIKINQSALSFCKAKSQFNQMINDNPGIVGCSSLYERKAYTQFNWPFKKIEVQLDTVDNYFKNNKILYIDWMKIDVEGSEYNVLLGAENCLKAGSIGGIQFEYGGTYQDAGVTLNQVIKYISNFKYAVYRFNSFFKEFERITEFVDDYEMINFYILPLYEA